MRKSSRVNLGILVFSRMNSNRLAGKATMEIAGMMLLERVIRRASLTGYPVVLATTIKDEDDILSRIATHLSIPCFRGSEENVLERAVLAAEAHKFEAFARLCGDRPLFSIQELKQAMQKFKISKPDLITNNYPQKCIRGLTTEVIRTSSLRYLLDNNPDAQEQEHMTVGFYRNPENHHIISLTTRYQKGENHTGFAVDTKDDYLFISKLIQQHPELDYEL